MDPTGSYTRHTIVKNVNLWRVLRFRVIFATVRMTGTNEHAISKELQLPLPI